MIKSPFPYFGGKRRIANIVWKRFGNAPNYVEPFAGSLAVLLGRPIKHFRRSRIETVNDKDAFIDNFWRALQAEPDVLAKWCDYPVNEASQHARHLWLVKHRERLTKKLMTDPHYYDVKIAGWWVWGLCMWIGNGWCKENKTTHSKQRPSLNNPGKGVHRSGLHGKRQNLGDAGRGIHRRRQNLKQYFQDLSNRLRYVRVCCGDWKRILGPTPTEKLGVTAVFLDPPYGDERKSGLYAVDNTKLYKEVRDWAVEHGDNLKLRIALCGYDTELSMPDNWEFVRWKSAGYDTQAKGNTKAKENARKEIVWFSPYCIDIKKQMGLLDRPLEVT